MRSLRFTLVGLALVAVCGAVAAATAPHADAGGQKIGVYKTKNVTKASRTARDIDQVIIHVTEGNFWSAVRWLRSPRARGSAHFVVSKQGEIVQMVDLKDVAWHAGNKRNNRRSVGIEHEGITKRGGFTQAQYEASARLLAYLSQQLDIPLDRRHVIGHNEVPHPSGRGRGGLNRHTDPGRHWRWGHYLALARQYVREPQQPAFARVTPPGEPKKPRPKAKPAPKAQPAAPQAQPDPAVPVAKERAIPCGGRQSVHTSTLQAGATVSGLVAWRAKTCGRFLRKVEFLVNGELVGKDSVWPFMLAGGKGLNTTQLVNGWHTLTVRAHGRRGYRVSNSIRVRVANKPFAVAPVGLGEGQAVRGSVGFRAFTNVPAKKVELVLGDEVVASSETRPHELAWDSRQVDNGRHELELRAEAFDGRTVRRALPVLVANEAVDAEPAPYVLWQSLTHWQPVGAPLPWQVLATGAIEQVEFWVDGKLRWTAVEQPFTFGGPGALWDPSPLGAGAHSVLVRAVGTGGRIAESTATVLVGG